VHGALRRDAGGTRSLGELLATRWGLLEADLLRYYRLDLRFEFESIGCRRLWALVAGLPSDAAVRRDGKVWTTREELAASHIELEHGLLRTIAEALGVKFKGPPMKPIQHPDRLTAEDTPKRMSTRDEIQAFMSRLRK
jgi:hypothetical protein